MTRSAPELYRLGRAHLNAGRNAAARRALALAAGRTDDTDLRARVAGSMAALVIRQGDPVEAERLCREALRLPSLSSGTEAYLLGQLGLLALERGDLDEAVELLDRAIAGIGDEAEHRAPMLLNRSIAHSEAGRLGPARADLDAAAPDYAATGNDVERAMAVHNRGWVALLEGDLVGALEFMAEAHDVLATASAVNAAICDLDRAQVLREAGLAIDAERMLGHVAAVFGAHLMRQARGEAELHLARSLLSHAPERAAEVAGAAARRFRRLGSDSWTLRADALRLRAILALGSPSETPSRRRGMSPPSDEAVRRVADGLDARRLHADAQSLRLSRELSVSAGPRPPTGRRRVHVRRDAPIQVRLLAHEVRAARAASAGDERGTRRHAAAGLDELARWHQSFGSLDLATSLVMHGRGLIFAGLSSAARSGRPEPLFEWSERARHLSVQVVPLRPPPDPALAEELAELRMLRVQNGADWLAGSRAAALEAHVRDRQWSATGSSVVEARVGMAELQAALGSETAVISYVFSGLGMVALVVTEDTTAVVAIDDWEQAAAVMPGLRADLDMASSVREGPLSDRVRDSLSRRLVTLSRVLVDEPVRAAGHRRLVVTVPGILSGVPWTMLPALRGRTLTLATSATRWVRARGHRRSPARSAGFAVGPRVARGSEEVRAAAAPWQGATVVLDATTDDVTDLAASVDVLHVAAHGRHTAGNPMFSGLELADGALFGYDVDRIPAVPETVVLSACEAGRSSVRWGEEAIGMTRVWLHAGTRAVIATPVVVADDDACELLGAVHVGLAAGRPASEALAEASARTGIVAPFQVHGNGF